MHTGVCAVGSGGACWFQARVVCMNRGERQPQFEQRPGRAGVLVARWGSLSDEGVVANFRRSLFRYYFTLLQRVRSRVGANGTAGVRI